MDRLEALGNQLSQLTMYDLKSAYNQAKNMVLNVSEMEAKVREATNDDPWGASSTLMQEIAQGTFNFQQFNEIMPCIYSRFMDKEARQWREIYKSLQLLEYIIKHGSERVVDDARSHLSTIKMLRNFHYIDDKGKDQGINVRNRAKELSEMLMDVDRIRAERRKAKANRNKYVGTGNDGMTFSGGGGRYGGFGSESLASGSRGYGGGGSYEQDYGGSSGGFRDSSGQRGFDEYNAGDDEISVPRRSNSTRTTGAGTTSRVSTSSAAPSAAPAPAPAKTSAKVVDLLGFGDEDDFSAPVSAPAPAAPEKALPAVSSNPLDDDEFDDFQTANPPAASNTVASKPVTATAAPSTTNAGRSANVFDMLGGGSAPLAPAVAPVKPVQPSMGSMGMGMMSPSSASAFASPVTSPAPGAGTGGFGNIMSPVMSPTSAVPPAGRGMGMGAGVRPTASTASSFASTTSTGTKASSGGFDDLWSMSLGSSGKASASASAGAAAGGAKSMKDLEREKAQASIWGGGGARPAAGGATGGSNANASAGSSGLDDLLF